MAEKRAVLASWVSDARAIENAPSLRRLDSGAVVEVDEILQALSSLDALTGDRRRDCKPLQPSARRPDVVSSWLRRLGPPGSDDDDDDPPPAPAGVGIPFRPKPLPPAYSRAPSGPGIGVRHWVNSLKSGGSRLRPSYVPDWSRLI